MQQRKCRRQLVKSHYATGDKVSEMLLECFKTIHKTCVLCGIIPLNQKLGVYGC